MRPLLEATPYLGCGRSQSAHHRQSQGKCFFFWFFQWTCARDCFYNNEQTLLQVAKVDCTVDSELCTKFNVMGYPTIILVSKDGTNHAFQAERVRVCLLYLQRAWLIRPPCASQILSAAYLDLWSVHCRPKMLSSILF